jgi:hypothetical protein
VAQSLFDQVASGSVQLDLLNTACLAARNSKLADMVEAERHAIKCQAASGQFRGIDLILQGEALELRNNAAGSAAKAFLGLVQVQMQRALVDESKQHLDDLEKTIQAASEAGFASDDGKQELAKGRIRLKKAETELNAAEQRLTYQLNLLTNIDMENLVEFKPVHELNLTNEPINVREQTELAAVHRPGIQAIESALAMGGDNPTLYQLLDQFDSRLGLRLAPNELKKRLLRRKLKELIAQNTAPDQATETRKSQVLQIIEARKQAARIETADALLTLQTSMEKLAIINEDLARLQARHEQLKAKQKIDARNSYLELNQNWVEMQQAKTDRIAAAIDHETAKIELLQAQGFLTTQCGFNFIPVNDCVVR